MNQHKRNTHSAHQAIRKKSDANFKRVIAIINDLRTNNKPINFNHIAKVAGVSKSWLYRRNEIKNLIDELRSKQQKNPGSISKTRTKDSVINALKHRIQKLEAENKELHRQVEVVYGELHLIQSKDKSK